MISLNAHDLQQAARLASLVRDLNGSGHNPATSGNYSLRSQTSAEFCLVSESGVDKGQFHEQNFLPVRYDNAALHESVAFSGRRSSAETGVHVSVYRATTANCVLHSHLLEALFFADLYPGQAVIHLEGLELLKGFKGITTHETRVAIPCFENTQDIVELSTRIEAALAGDELTYGLLLRRHGLYVWGDSVADAKRHLEVFEYMFKYYLYHKGSLV